jgi:2-methylcitrate dehydratase PrpD
MGITMEMATLVANTRLQDIEDDDVQYSKTLLMSALGAMVAGHASMGSDIVTRFVKRGGGNQEALVFGERFRTNVEAAALANATYAHATEYEDDSFPEAVSSYTTFPAILAMAEYLGSSGEDILAAFIAGYEAQARIGLACREARRLGYMVLCLAGSLGCAASAARLLKLNPEETANAISIAASQASGLGYQTGSMAHIIEMGFAARNGITAAMLARDGFTGQKDVLEAPRGLFNIITGGKVDNPDSIIGDWGKPYRIREIGIKSYPCCYHLQRIIETTVDLRDAGVIKPEEIESVKVEVNAFFPTVVQHPEPKDPITAQFSLPHAVAIALLEDRVTPASFAQQKIDDPALTAMRKRVEMIVREDWGWTPTGWTPTITYTMKDGTVQVNKPERARGQPPELLSFDQCIPKYRDCVDRFMDEKNILASIEVMRNLEKMGDAKELISVLED